MKTFLYFSLSVLAAVLLTDVITSQVVSVPTTGTTGDTRAYVINRNRALIIQGKVAGDLKNWLSVETANGRDFYDNGFDPSYTRVVSDYKPMFRKLSNGQWEIMFTSEIAENIP